MTANIAVNNSLFLQNYMLRWIVVYCIPSISARMFYREELSTPDVYNYITDMPSSWQYIDQMKFDCIVFMNCRQIKEHILRDVFFLFARQCPHNNICM